MTRKGAPFQGTIGEIKTASWVTCSQFSLARAFGTAVSKQTNDAPPINSKKAARAEVIARARNKIAPVSRRLKGSAQSWQNHRGCIPLQIRNRQRQKRSNIRQKEC
jgi:hypothetical protein